MIIQKFPHYVIKHGIIQDGQFFQRGFSTGRKYKLVQKKYRKAYYVQRRVQKEESNRFYRGRKKFGGGGEFECGMTQSNQKN